MRYLLLAAGLATAAAAVPVAASAGPYRTDPLVTVTGASPFAGCTADQTPTNLDGNPTMFVGSELEPWVDVNPTDPLNLVGGYQQDRWSDGGARGLGFATSLDGGKTWKKGVIPNVSLCSNRPGWTGLGFERATDPWVTFGPDGSVFFFSLSFDNTPPANRPGGDGKNALLVSKSTDKGLTWSDPKLVILDTEPQFFNDKNALTADPELVDGQVYVYAAWDRLHSAMGFVINPEKTFASYKGPAYFNRTTDGGETWEAARAVYDPGSNNQVIGAQVAVAADGTLLYVFNEVYFAKQNGGGPFNTCYVSFIYSTDKGASFTNGPANKAARMLTTGCAGRGVQDPERLDADGRKLQVRTGDIIPQIAVDRNRGSRFYGRVYVVWQDYRFNPSDPSNPYTTNVPGDGARYDEVALAYSDDGGRTWSAPARVNAPSGRSAFTPVVKVASDGTVGVLYYDFRNDKLGDAALSTDAWLTHSHDGGATWSETRVTPKPFDMRRAPYASGWFLGDYIGLGVIGPHFKPFFTVTTTSDPDNIVSTTVGP